MKWFLAVKPLVLLRFTFVKLILCEKIKKTVKYMEGCADANGVANTVMPFGYSV